ncbi:histidyl-trna synthetase [Holotrichia oblita]|nr:histidyl-trna synthetase [Holotrichia oblita]
MTLALRPDMTPAIARIAATAYTDTHLPMRFSYISNAFRHNESYQGKIKEFTQAGVELIGSSSADATAEVVAVAINSLLQTGLTDFCINIGCVAFFKEILTDTGFEQKEAKQFQKYILAKDFVSAQKMLHNSTAPKNIQTLFTELPFLIGGKEILKKAADLTHNKKALAALTQLENIHDILACYGMENYILYDLGMIGHLDYYSGIIFRGYARGATSSIVDGGRYDNLLSRFGTDYPAVGFSIKVNMLLSALLYMHPSSNTPDALADTLVAYTPEGRKAAMTIADELRSTGVHIENSLICGDLDTNIRYAKNKKMGGILYFLDHEKVEIVDLNNNERKIVNIADQF